MMKQNNAQGTTRPGMGRKLGIVVLIAAMVGMGYYGWTTYSRYTHGLPPNQNQTPGAMGPGGPRMNAAGARPGPPSPEQRRERMNQMMRELNLSGEQRAQMDKLWEGPPPDSREARQERRQTMEQILTPEQQQQARQMMRQGMQRRLDRARQTLSPKDFATLERRIQDRMDGRRGGGGFGGRGGGGGRGGQGGPPPPDGGEGR